MPLGVLVFTHAGLADGFVSAAEMILGGPQKRFAAVAFREGDDLIQKSQEIGEAIRGMDAAFTVVLTDLFGASPANAASLAIVEAQAAIVTGANLSMLLEALTFDWEGMSRDDILGQLCAAGKGGIRTITREMILEGVK